MHKPLNTIENLCEPMYQCQHCTYSTKRSNNLRKHDTGMHNDSEEQKMYQCQYCTYTIMQSYNIRKHEKAMQKELKLNEK